MRPVSITFRKPNGLLQHFGIVSEYWEAGISAYLDKVAQGWLLTVRYSNGQRCTFRKRVK